MVTEEKQGDTLETPSPETEEVKDEKTTEEPPEDWKLKYEESQGLLATEQEGRKRDADNARGLQIGLMQMAERDRLNRDMADKVELILEATISGETEGLPAKLVQRQQERTKETGDATAQAAKEEAEIEVNRVGKLLDLNPNLDEAFKPALLYYNQAKESDNPALFYEKARNEALRLEDKMAAKAELEKVKAEAKQEVKQGTRNDLDNFDGTGLGGSGLSDEAAFLQYGRDGQMSDGAKRYAQKMRIIP
jgi:hypothetical protein